MDRLKCDWKRDDRRCSSEPRFLCSQSHVLCGRHAATLRDGRKRRSTDRECLLCYSRDIIDFYAESNTMVLQRRAKDGSPQAVQASVNVAVEIIRRLRYPEDASLVPAPDSMARVRTAPNKNNCAE